MNSTNTKETTSISRNKIAIFYATLVATSICYTEYAGGLGALAWRIYASRMEQA